VDTEDEEASASAPVSSLLTVRSDHRVARALVAVAAAIVLLLVFVGRAAPPWTLEGLLIAHASRNGAGPARSGAAARDSGPGETLADRVDAALARNDVSEELKLALVDELARDPRDGATDTLLRAAHHPSLLLSMAALKGLTGRPCARLESDLNELLQDDDWQRRAWAAKVLGDSGCEKAGTALTDRWQAESDDRVREQIADAMSALRASATR
jgi:hypothetical protein